MNGTRRPDISQGAGPSTPRGEVQLNRDQGQDLRPELNDDGLGWFKGCCRMAPMVNGCCVKGDDTVVETLGEEVFIQGYEFPILQKMRNDGTDNRPNPSADPSVPNAAMRNMMEQQRNPHPAHSAKSYGGVGLDEPRDPSERDQYDRGRKQNQARNDPIPDMDELQKMSEADNGRRGSSVEIQPVQAYTGYREEEQKKVQAPPPRQDEEPKSAKRFMDEVNVLKEAWWCCYCCCSGIGCGSPAFFRFLTKCCCCRMNCESADPNHKNEDDHQGAYQHICSCCFCHNVCQCPCRPGMPRCICCSEQLHTCGRYKRPQGGEPQHSGEAGAQPMFEYLMHDAFTPCFCCCTGCSCKQEVLACCHISTICCGCHFLCEEAMPEWGPDALCHCLLTCTRCYSACSFPPKKENNPRCAFCGWRLKKTGYNHGKITGGKSQGNSGDQMSAPEQVSMD